MKKINQYYRWTTKSINYLRYQIEVEKKSPAVVAKELGLHRTRIYQVMKKHKIQPSLHTMARVDHLEAVEQTLREALRALTTENRKKTSTNS